MPFTAEPQHEKKYGDSTIKYRLHHPRQNDTMSEREPKKAELASGERRMMFTGAACETMSEREPKKAELASGERRMTFTGAACETTSEREPKKAKLASGERRMMFTGAACETGKVDAALAGDCGIVLVWEKKFRFR